MNENNNGYNQPVTEPVSHQENYSYTHYTQPQPDYEVDRCVDEAFSKGLAAAIMASFPVASIIAIVFGNNSTKMVERARTLAAQRGSILSGKNIAANVLGKVGKYAGIAMTVFWAFYMFIYFIIIVAMLSGM